MLRDELNCEMRRAEHGWELVDLNKAPTSTGSIKIPRGTNFAALFPERVAEKVLPTVTNVMNN